MNLKLREENQVLLSFESLMDHDSIVDDELSDALPNHGVKPTWGFHKVKLRKVEIGSTLPASNSRKG